MGNIEKIIQGSVQAVDDNFLQTEQGNISLAVLYVIHESPVNF